MAKSDEVELEVEELMVSRSLDALCHAAQHLDLDKKYWEGKPNLFVIKSIRNCLMLAIQRLRRLA